MTTVARPQPYTTSRAPSSGVAPRVEISSALAAIEREWLGVETAAWATPFQRYDWVSAYLGGTQSGDEVRIASVRDEAGRIRLILPLAMSRVLGCRVGTPIGGKHASYALPLLARPAALPEADELFAMLGAIGQEIGLDAIVFPDTPAAWAGSASPLARWGVTGANRAHRLTLSLDADETLRRAVSKDSRKKLRAKARSLAALGAVMFERASNDAAVERALSTFLRQKQERFTQQGIRDPFLHEGVRRFLRLATRPARDGASPAIEVFTLSLDGRVLAVFGAAADGRNLSGMFVSFEAADETSRFSPGELLLVHVIRDCCARGFTGFDLGVGDARFKRTFCNEDVALLDVIVPLTMRGRAYRSCRRAIVDLKRRLKASPTGMRLLGTARRLRSGRAEAPPPSAATPAE